MTHPSVKHVVKGALPRAYLSGVTAHGLSSSLDMLFTSNVGELVYLFKLALNHPLTEHVSNCLRMYYPPKIFPCDRI
jgi:hypothetical protein